MGGVGSSRWGGGSTKCQTVYCLPIDIRKLKRLGKLAQGPHLITWPRGSSASLHINDDESVVVFSFAQNGKQCERQVMLEKTPCHFGGERPWFSCPLCSNRCAVLYLKQTAIACRRCSGLLYPSQSETESTRAIRKAQRLGKRLGFGVDLISGRILNQHKGPPPRMSKQTYDRLLIEYEHAVNRAVLLV